MILEFLPERRQSSKFIQNIDMRLNPLKGLMFMLTIDTEEFSSDLRKHPERRQISIDKGPAPAGPGKGSPKQKGILP